MDWQTLSCWRVTPEAGRPPRGAGLGRGLLTGLPPAAHGGREMESREHGGLPQAAGPASRMHRRDICYE